MTENTNVETQNEVAQVETNVSVIQREDENYVIVKGENGKYKRKAKFSDFSSIKVESREDKIWMMNLLDGDEDSGNGLKDHVGKIIEVQDVITRSYDKINEDTGELEYGVLTYLITPDKVPYVTSSKNVYFSITRIMELFGKPDAPNWVNIKVKVAKQKRENGDMIKIKMVG